MGQGFSIIRALARLNAMGALTGSAVLMLITCVSSPVFPSINFSTTHFDDGGELDLGMWGASDLFLQAHAAAGCRRGADREVLRLFCRLLLHKRIGSEDMQQDLGRLQPQ